MDQAAALVVDAAQRFASAFSVRAALNAELHAGTMLVLFGPSGGGKTTILRQIAGLERPDEGTIRFGGEVWCDVARQLWRPPQARSVGIVFQEPTLFPHLTVRDNVHYGLRREGLAPGSGTKVWHPGLAPGSGTGVWHRGLAPRSDTTELRHQSPDTRTPPNGDASADLAEIVRVLGIGDLENRYPRALSGGEAQRVALARALATRPRLLLLDEPFAALDAPTRLRLRRDVRALLQTTGTPAVLVTHDRTEALAMGDLVAVVIAGRVRQTGPIADVFSRPADPEVAASLGVEAVLPAHVIGSADGLIEVAVDHVVLHVAERDPLPPGSEVYVCIRAEDVTLETHGAGQASTRNHLAARVVGITSEGPIDRVALDCGFPLDALITRRSRDELHVAAGAHVTAGIKATSVHLVPRF